MFDEIRFIRPRVATSSSGLRLSSIVTDIMLLSSALQAATLLSAKLYKPVLAKASSNAIVVLKDDYHVGY